MSLDVFLPRHARTGQPIGVVVVGDRGMISLDARSRDTCHLTVTERGCDPLGRSFSRRGGDLFRVVAALLRL